MQDGTSKPTIEREGDLITIHGEDPGMQFQIKRLEKGVLLLFQSTEPIALTDAEASALSEALKI